MVILPITSSDFAVWLELRMALWPWHTLEELTADQETLASDPGCINFIAWEPDESGIAVGMIELATRPHAPGSKDAPIPYIEGWYVAPDFRGKGVGRALVEAGEAWALKRGFTRMASDTIPLTYPTSPAAHAAMGYRVAAEYPAGVIEDEPSIHFIKDL